MRTLHKLPLAILAGGFIGVMGWSDRGYAAISYTSAGDTYVETFDSSTSMDALLAWTDDSTIPGWYAYVSGGANVSAGEPAYIPTKGPVAGSYSIAMSVQGTDPLYYNYLMTMINYDGVSAGVGKGYVAVGMALVNDTGTMLHTVSLSYAAKSFGAIVTNPDTVGLSYALDATGIADADGDYISIANGGYTTNPGVPVIETISVTLTDISWAPGETLFIRWKDVNVGYTDQINTIDNISLAATAIPEPASIAMMGIGLAGLLKLRRR